MFDNQQQTTPQNDSALGQQIQRLIDGFKSLKEKHAALRDEHEELKNQLSSIENTRDEKILELEIANERITELETLKADLENKVATITAEKENLGNTLLEANNKANSISEKLQDILPLLDEV